MNWNQYLKADTNQSLKNALVNLENAMSFITEAIEELDETMKELKASDLPTYKIDNIKTELNDTQDKIDNRIDALEAVLEALDS
jgi:septal ring factor EnvC (AmiA/AmiB activator)